MSALFSQALRRGATVLGKSVGQSMFRGVVARPTSLLNPAPTFPVASGRFAQPTMRHLFVSTAKGSNGARNWVRGQRWIPAGLRRGSVNILAVRVATKAGCKGGPVVAKAKTPLSTILWRCLWVPYFLLAFIPHSFLAATIYHALRGNHAKSRGWAFYTVTGYICLPLSMVVNLSAPFVYLFDWDRRLFFNYMTKLWGKITTYPFVVPKIIGAELIPQDGRKMVLVSNHQSWLDIFCMCWLPDDVILRFISKVQIAYIPVVGWSMALLGHVLFDRSTGGKQLLTDCAGLLAKGIPVFFFPEGTRSRDPHQLLPFKAGAFKLAKDARATVVPITIVGTAAIMGIGHEAELQLEPDENGCMPGVTIVVHPPIEVGDDDTVASLRDRSAAAIQAGLDAYSTPSPPSTAETSVPVA